jgi:hypothetical protein
VQQAVIFQVFPGNKVFKSSFVEEYEDIKDIIEAHALESGVNPSAGRSI